MSAIAVMNDPNLTLPEKIRRAEAIMRARGKPVEIRCEHTFSDGVYARKIFIPAGTLLTGKIHKRENLNYLLEGEMMVSTDNGMETVKGWREILSPPGTKRIALTITECVWVTIHGTHERDLEKIEAEFIAQDEADYQAYLVSKEPQRLGGAAWPG